MSYITTSQLSDRLGATLYARLTDRVAGITADDTVAQRVVDDAEALADSHLGRRYDTPIDLAAHPELADLLKARVLDLAEFGVWQGSPFVSDPPQRVHLLRATAIEWFEDLARGDLVMGSSPGLAPTSEDAPRFTASPRTLTSEELDGL